jgi:hypothetical protein
MKDCLFSKRISTQCIEIGRLCVHIDHAYTTVSVKELYSHGIDDDSSRSQRKNQPMAICSIEFLLEIKSLIVTDETHQ